MKFVIEHMEPELSEWALIEYEQMSKYVGKENLIFTNIKTKENQDKLKEFGKVQEQSVKDLGLTDDCILDPAANNELTSNDCNNFKYLIFGGILGDYPPKARTKELTDIYKTDTRHLGPEQMSTDTAVLVCKMISDGKELDKIHFQDHITLQIEEGQEVELPYRYVIKDDKPMISEKLIEHLKRDDIF